MFMLRLWFCLLVTLVTPLLSDAATYYVDKAGSDANSCATAATAASDRTKAKLTIGSHHTASGGVNCARTAGDTVIVGDGTYVNGEIAFQVDGTSGSRITMRAENKWSAVISSTSSCAPNISVYADYVTIDGFSLVVNGGNVNCSTPNSASQTGVRCWTGALACHVRNIKTDDPTGPGGKIRGHGVKTNSHDSIVEDNELGAGFESMGHRVIARRNRITGGGLWNNGIVVKGGVQDNQIYDNLVIGSSITGYGIVLGGATCAGCSGAGYDQSQECWNCVAWNNVVRIANGANGLTFMGARDSAFFNNIVFNAKIGTNTYQATNINNRWINNIIHCGNVTAATSFTSPGTYTINYNNFYQCSGTPTQTNAITGNPLFVNDTSDWHLQAGSPAIGTGTVGTFNDFAGSPIVISADYAGVTRTAPWSLGIYAAVSASDTTAPTTPTATATANGAGQITVTWTAATDAGGVTGYNIRRCTPTPCTPSVTLATVSGSTLSYVDTGLSSGTGYSYTVNAFDGASNQGVYSSVASATTTATFKTILSYDLFDRADGADLGASWTAAYTGLQPFKIVSNRVLPSVLSNSSIESYTGIASSADQWAQVTLSIYNSATSAAGVVVRLQASPTFTAYECRVTNGTTSEIVEWAAGVQTTVIGTATATWLETDQIRCEAEGTALRFYRIRNGAETLITSGTDGTLATGYTGLKQFETTDLTDVQFDNFVTGGFSGTAPTEAAISTVDASTTQATITYTGTPVWIRVETATVSVVEPLASFPGGVYTYPSTIAASLTGTICFYPRNALGTENASGSACDTTVTVTDTTAPVITNTTPATWPVDTTTIMLTVTTNEPATCKYSTDNFVDLELTVPMADVSLTHSSGISGATNNTSYTYYVRCTDALANESASTTVNTAVDAATADTTPPSTVTNLVATAISSTQAELVWTAATDAGGIAGYQVYMCSYTTEICTSYGIAGQPVPSTTFVVALQPSTNYAFVIKAIDTSSNISAAYSNVATVTTSGLIDHEAPSTMTNLAAVAYSASVKLTWNAGTDNSGLVFSIIEQCQGAACSNFTVVKTDIAGTQLIRSLSPSTVYCFRGKHSDISGNVSAAYSGTVCTTTTASGLGQPRASSAQRSTATVRASR